MVFRHTAMVSPQPQVQFCWLACRITSACCSPVNPERSTPGRLARDAVAGDVEVGASAETEFVGALLLESNRNTPAIANNMNNPTPITVFLGKSSLSLLAQQFLYFFPLPQGQRALRPIFVIFFTNGNN